MDTQEMRSGVFPSATPEQVSAQFQHEIFKYGVFHFDPSKFTATSEQVLQGLRDAEQISVTRWRAEEQGKWLWQSEYAQNWGKTYDGKIPTLWKSWLVAAHDFEEIRRLGIRIPDSLVTAGITHPIGYVAKFAALSQPLSLEQVALFSLRPDINPADIYEVIIAQPGADEDTDTFNTINWGAFEIAEKMRNNPQENPFTKYPPIS